MPCPACLLCVTAGRHEGDGPATGQEDVLPVPPADGSVPCRGHGPGTVSRQDEAWQEAALHGPGAYAPERGSTGGDSLPLLSHAYP